MVETVTAVEFYQGPLTVCAFMVGWVSAMITGAFFSHVVR